MTLSDINIEKLLAEKEIVIDPFNPLNLNNTSYDVSLGNFFYRENSSQSLGFHNMYDEKSVRNVWGIQEEALPLKYWTDDKQRFKYYLLENAMRMGINIRHDNIENMINYSFKDIAPDDLVFFIFPQETVLGHTIEFIGGRTRVTTKMQARSSTGRNFIEVCKDAGWGDVGYFNRWTMELTNNSSGKVIPLVVGSRIAQIIFEEVGEVKRNYNAVSDSKYQTTDDLNELMKSWSHEMMIPKTWGKRK